MAPSDGLDGDEPTADLEAIVFGRSTTVEPRAPKREADVEAPELEPAGRRKKRKPAEAEEEEDEEEEEEDDDDDELPEEVKAKPAWEDPDDAKLEVDVTTRNRLRKFRFNQKETMISGTEYERRLRDQFVKQHGSQRWVEESTKAAEATSDSSDAEGDAGLVPRSKWLDDGRKSDGVLRPTEIEITPLKDVPIYDGKLKGDAKIMAIEFHPDSTLMLSATHDKFLRLFAVDGDESTKVSSYQFKGFPIKNARFLPGGDTIVLTGLKQRMWGLDVRTGEPFEFHRRGHQPEDKMFGLTPGPHPVDAGDLRSSSMFAVLGSSGATYLFDVATRTPLRTMRMSTPGTAAAFSPGRDVLWTADVGNHIYEWDLRSGRCIQKKAHTWATGISMLATPSRSSAQKPILATGLQSGNVDCFDLSEPKLPKEPTHSIGNITTCVTSLKFHNSGELLAAASCHKADQLKLVHTGTMTVFKNWPPQKAPLHNVTTLDFSRNGGYFAVGNDYGRVLLYRLKHFEAK